MDAGNECGVTVEDFSDWRQGDHLQVGRQKRKTEAEKKDVLARLPEPPVGPRQLLCQLCGQPQALWTIPLTCGDPVPGL